MSQPKAKTAFCLKCSTEFYATLEARLRIDQWKAYAEGKNLSKALLRKGIKRLTPCGHRKAIEALTLHIFQDH